jgi:hypothetical protein
MSKLKSAIILILSIMVLSCSGGDDGGNDPNSGDIQDGLLTDSRDGKKYKTIVIDGQTWMADNLNYNVAGSKCYDDLESNCNMYGRLYDWAMAMALPFSCNSTICSGQINAKHKGICPNGWHIPKIEEFKNKFEYECDFDSSLLCTYFYSRGGMSIGNTFWNCGSNNFWWSASETDDYHAVIDIYSGLNNNCYYDYNYYLNANGTSHNSKSLMPSVRCVKD